MTLKDIIASSLVIALGVILIIHFVLFWIYGGVFIYENNKVILTLETLMSITIVLFGIERLVSNINKSIQQEASTASQSMVEERVPQQRIPQRRREFYPQPRRKLVQPILQHQLSQK